MNSPPSPLQRYHSIIEDVPAFEAAIRRSLTRFIWVHQMRIEPAKLAALLQADGYRLSPLVWNPGAFRVTLEPTPLGGHWTYQAGFFHIQEAASMVPVLLLSPRPGMRIMDLCAAPGNKTVQAASAMENSGTVVANDLRHQRMASIRMHVDRLGLINVSTTCRDGGSYPRKAGLFDAVLVDAPCSCEGTSRKNTDILQRPVPGRGRLLMRQKRLLERAVRLCRPGGRIVYSTCTYDPEENEAVVDAVLRDMPDKVEMLPSSLPGLRAAAGVTSWHQERYHPDLRHALRIWPHLNDTGGFFAAVLQRTGGLFLPPEPSPALSDPGYEDENRKGYRLFPEPEQITSLLSNRFGIARSALDNLCLLTRNRRQVFVAASDHRPTVEPPPATGLPLLHLSMKTPKLTTAGAAFLGRFARCNVIDVDTDQLGRYLTRRSFSLHRSQLAETNEDGHVLIRYDGAVLGVGRLFKSQMKVDSFYPKRFAALVTDG
ncbi:MAG: RsmB/NOP family class I SAM-dependent RNA methyltransferase [Desulfobacterales bacterium]|nr:RsmB/NOP family class I SAM-dependent RNA methyltransferase [Desulfobacterales bacterium]